VAGANQPASLKGPNRLGGSGSALLGGSSAMFPFSVAAQLREPCAAGADGCTATVIVAVSDSDGSADSQDQGKRRSRDGWRCAW